MADFDRMYFKLFRAITAAVEILQTAQAEAEEIYISYEPGIKHLTIEEVPHEKE